MKKRIFKNSKTELGIILLVVLMMFFLWWPLPDYVETPGDANNLKTMVKIQRRPDRDPGKLMLTSVGVIPARPVSYLWAKLDPNDSIVSSNAITGNENNSTYERVQQFYMRSAINEAIYTAFSASHHSVKKRYRGIYVVDVMRNSGLKNRVKAGDTVTEINHRHFSSALGYQNYLKRQHVDSRVQLEFERNGTVHRTSDRLVRLPGTARPGVGVLLGDNFAVKTKLPVHVNPRKIGGPSGGLMFALQMYDQLTHGHLKRNRIIAGTGTINAHGQVGEIGGIDKKVIAAKRRGASIFLAPYVKPTAAVRKIEPGHLTNYQLVCRTARKDAPHLKVIPVTSFRQAIRLLEK